MKFLQAAAFAVMLTLAAFRCSLLKSRNRRRKNPSSRMRRKRNSPRRRENRNPNRMTARIPRPQPDKDKKPGDRCDRAARADSRSAKKTAPPRTSRNSGRTRTDGGGHRIPEERFRASFGTEHHFRVARRSDRHFEYGGYAFEYVDAWPADWSDTDDVYIVLIGDDYYFVDVHRPELRLRLILVD